MKVKIEYTFGKGNRYIVEISRSRHGKYLRFTHAFLRLLRRGKIEKPPNEWIPYLMI